ncbi:YncE family protein [Streptomyces daliensis]|uniref:YncE family protein n=1 Tax=Streptomyces daliensis TaxID=299421 RepID=A0A8T4J1M7_9ACTN|nr:YncE family protein [Streptomyces daliensis]
MAPPNRRLLLAVATAAALTVGGALAPAGAATATGSDHGNRGDHSHLGVTSAPLVRGLYQSAYSERHDALWITASVGQPPAAATSSHLVKADPDTLKIEAVYPVGATPSGGIESVHGIDVDDEHGTVWVTGTRDNSVSVYSQRTGKRLATLPGVSHSREVVVDRRRDTVWASAFGDGSLVAYDSRTFEEKKRVTVEGAGPTGLAVNERTGTVYAADHTHDRIIELAADSDEPRFLPAGDGPLAVALSRDGRTAYTADQTTGTLSVLDLREGDITATVRTGEGAKSLAVAPRSGRVLVVGRLVGKVSVVDPHRGTVERTVDTGPLPNHIAMAEDGTAFVTDKSGTGPAGEDRLTRIAPVHGTAHRRK